MQQGCDMEVLHVHMSNMNNRENLIVVYDNSNINKHYDKFI